MTPVAAAAPHQDPLLPEGPGTAGWLALLSGLVPFMVLWPQPGLLWPVALFAMAWARRREKPPLWLSTLVAALATLPGLWIGYAHKDAIGGFGIFLALAMITTLAGARSRNEHRVPFLLAFILLMAVGHKTLEIFFLVPVAAFFAGYAFSRMGEGLDDRSPIPSGRFVAGMVVASAILAVPIFVLMPRTRLSVMAMTSRGSLSGFTGRIGFGDLGAIKLSDRLVMRVKTDRPGLLKGNVLDRYLGRGWANSYQGTRASADPDQPLLIAEPDLFGEGKPLAAGVRGPQGPDPGDEPRVLVPDQVVVQEILLEPFEQPVLFARSPALAVWAPGKHLAATTQGDLVKLGHEARLEKVAYKAYSHLVEPTREAMLAAGMPSRQGRFHDSYLQLPEGLPEVVARTAREVAGRHATALEKAEAIQEWLGARFTYSLERRVDPAKDAIADLLEGDPRGHCEYFASALAVMLRTQGVYTRVAVGFAAGDLNPYSGTFTVRDRDAHAWTEVWLGNELGWRTFDPTPPDPSHVDGPGDGNPLWLWMAAQLDQVDTWWQNHVVNYYYNEGGPGAESWLYRLDDFFVKTLGFTWLTRNPDELLAQAGRWAAGVAGLLVLVFGLRRVSLGLGISWTGVWGRLWAALRAWLAAGLARLGRSPAASVPDQGEAARLFSTWVTRQADLGRIRAPGSTPREFLASVTRSDPSEAEVGGMVVRAYEAEAFAERPDPALVEEVRRRLG